MGCTVVTRGAQSCGAPRQTIVTSCELLLQHFTTVTCWHFISTHFLRASLVLIFPVLTSPLRCRSSMVKRTRLRRSVITVGDKDGCRPRDARTRDAVSAAEATGWKVTPGIFALITHFVAGRFQVILHISSCVCVSFCFLSALTEPSCVIRPPT